MSVTSPDIATPACGRPSFELARFGAGRRTRQMKRGTGFARSGPVNGFRRESTDRWDGLLGGTAEQVRGRSSALVSMNSSPAITPPTGMSEQRPGRNPIPGAAGGSTASPARAARQAQPRHLLAQGRQPGSLSQPGRPGRDRRRGRRRPARVPRGVRADSGRLEFLSERLFTAGGFAAWALARAWSRHRVRPQVAPILNTPRSRSEVRRHRPNTPQPLILTVAPQAA
jgi:hypothetical protein